MGDTWTPRAELPAPVAASRQDVGGEHSIWWSSPVTNLLLVCIALPFVIGYIVLPIPFESQVISSSVLLFILLMLARYRPDLRILLVLISSTVSLRYILWRATNTLDFFDPWDLLLGIVLFLAECYGVLILLLGYFQTIHELRRVPVPLPDDISKLPTVDVFIPTYNESTDIVGRTAAGALRMDYPKKRVYILDDKRRPAMRALAEELGCHYLTRADNSHAKAGNINAALKKTDGELIAIFDADHVPVRSFLQMTVGFFLQDPKVALVQTPHHFFNPDPFQRNLLAEGRVPAEQELFYHVIMVGNDFWNSAFFCGSCALLQRKALEEVGGIAQETVTEDAHTAMRLHARGYRSAYLDIPQAAGLATERFAFHVKQRVRWAQGMVQIFRLDNPLIKKGLAFAQRLNYFNAMLHFFFGIPRLVYVIAPLTYLLFGARPLRGDPWEVFAYALPHFIMALVATSIVQRGFRHSFWAEVYEMAIAWPTARITTLTLLSPKHASFNVTTKGDDLLERPEFDWRNALPNMILLTLSLIGLAVAPVRFHYAPVEAGTILLNSLWTLFNILILCTALSVALEQRQLRRSYRVLRSLTATVFLEDGTQLNLRTDNVSERGCRIRFPGQEVPTGVSAVELSSSSGIKVRLQAKLIYHLRDSSGLQVGLHFPDMEEAQRLALMYVIYGSADSWILPESRAAGGLMGFFEILGTPFRVLGTLAGARKVSTRS